MQPRAGGENVRAVLMVGGRGVRLRPFTTTIPKPLVPIGGECPILEVLLRQLRRYRIEDVTLAIGHMGHLIRSYVGDGSAWGLRVDYWEDGEPLGTVGPLLEHVEELPETVLVLNGDLLCSLDFNALIAFHLEHGSELTLAASRQDVKIDFGVLDLDGADLLAFREKPRFQYHVNMGIYVVAAHRARALRARTSDRRRRSHQPTAVERPEPEGVQVRRVLARYRPARGLRQGQRRVRAAPARAAR